MRKGALAFTLYHVALFGLVSGLADMPQWLQKRTGLQAWPGYDAPYINETNHRFDSIQNVPPRHNGECDGVTDADCSFDCHNCFAPRDIFKCRYLSQTFDDGPSEVTHILLNYLKLHNTKTTFFLIGLNVIQYPEIVRRQNTEGHLLAVHTWSHKYLPELSNEGVFAELQWSIWAINATSGLVPKYFRPPYGGVDNRIRSIAEQLGLKIVLWDHDIKDWELNIGSSDYDEKFKSASKWVEPSSPHKWYRKKNSQTGIILEHDLTIKTVQLAKNIHQLLAKNQKRIDKC